MRASGFQGPVPHWSSRQTVSATAKQLVGLCTEASQTPHDVARLGAFGDVEGRQVVPTNPVHVRSVIGEKLGNPEVATVARAPQRAGRILARRRGVTREAALYAIEQS